MRCTAPSAAHSRGSGAILAALKKEAGLEDAGATNEATAKAEIEARLRLVLHVPANSQEDLHQSPIYQGLRAVP
jgi:hypothetical protein